MKTLFVAGMAGWIISMTPATSRGQDVTPGAWMPSVSPGQIVRYEFVYTKFGSGATTYSGRVDLALNPTTLYYREYRGDRAYRGVLYARDARHVLLFNHVQNRLATEELKGDRPGEFVERLYAIPAATLAATPDGKVTIKFSAPRGIAGGVFDVRLLRPEANE